MSNDTITVKVIWTETTEYERIVELPKKRWRKMREEFSEIADVEFSLGDGSLQDSLYDELFLNDGQSTVRDTDINDVVFLQAKPVRVRRLAKK